MIAEFLPLLIFTVQGHSTLYPSTDIPFFTELWGQQKLCISKGQSSEVKDRPFLPLFSLPPRCPQAWWGVKNLWTITGLQDSIDAFQNAVRVFSTRVPAPVTPNCLGSLNLGPQHSCPTPVYILQSMAAMPFSGKKSPESIHSPSAIAAVEVPLILFLGWGRN